MQDMQNALIRLVAYGRNTDLLPEEDEIYTVNRLLEHVRRRVWKIWKKF